MGNHDFQPSPQAPRGEPRAARGRARNAGSHDDSGAMAIWLLNRALAVAQAAARRCECQYVAALRSHAPALAAAALAHANDAQTHTQRICARIGQLGGETDISDLTPDARVSPNPSAARLAHSLPALLCNHLMAEREAIDSYTEIASFFRPFDPATWRLIDDIATGTEQRKREVSDLLAAISNA